MFNNMFARDPAFEDRIVEEQTGTKFSNRSFFHLNFVKSVCPCIGYITYMDVVKVIKER